MKLLTVLVLVALPLSCFAGSGCSLVDNLVSMAIDPTVSVSEFQNFLQPYTPDKTTELALGELKECFLNQSNETLANVNLMMETIYDSKWCSNY